MTDVPGGKAFRHARSHPKPGWNLLDILASQSLGRCSKCLFYLKKSALFKELWLPSAIILGV